MDKKVLIISMVAIAIVSAGAVAAISMNYDSDMKTASFDGIKMKLPTDAKFTKTVAGFEDTKYGISVQTFKSTDAMTNYLNSLEGAKMISIANLPANSVAFEQGDSTYIMITNGKLGICVGALDKDLVVEMANSVVFPEKSNKVSHNPTIIGKNPPKSDVDFVFIKQVINKVTVNNATFNEGDLNITIDNSTNLTDIQDKLNSDLDPSNDIDSTGELIDRTEYNSDSSHGASSSNRGILSAPGIGLINDMLNGGSNSYYSGESQLSDISTSSDISNDDVAGGDRGFDENTEEKLSESECRNLAESAIPSEYSISSVNQNGDSYIFEIEDEDGKSVGTVTVDSITGDVDAQL